MHNKISAGLAALALGAMMLPAAWAQDAASAQAGGPPPPAMHGHGRGDPNEQLRHMTRALNLTSAQQPQVKQVLVERDSQMSQLRQNTSLSASQRKAQEKSIWMDSDTKIRALLTDQQKQQFDAMRADQMEKHQAMHGGGAPPAEGSDAAVEGAA